MKGQPSWYDPRLQSLRGLAALIVLIGHASLVVPRSAYSVTLGTIFEQNSAVIFFYVLSGFVLAGKIRREQNNFRRWLVERTTRLVPVFWASIIYATLIAMSIRQQPIVGAGRWLNRNFLSIDTSAGAIGANLLAFSTKITGGTLWSLQVELLAIVFLPPMIALIDRLSPRQNWLVLIGLLVVQSGPPSPFGFFFCFYLGALVPYVIANERARDALGRGWLLLVGLAVAVALKPAAEAGLVPLATKITFDALLSVQIIAFVTSRRSAIDHLLSWSLVNKLGDISYSFYAFGQITLVGCAVFLFTILPTGFYASPLGALMLALVSLALALIVALPVASLSHRLLETRLRRALLVAMQINSRGSNFASPDAQTYAPPPRGVVDRCR
jgi:peptidoglycan/LPS O-acetylase OafA/YrhL